jgi:outer membrane lipoprotein SlyB
MDIRLDWHSIAGVVAPIAPKLGAVLGTVIGSAILPGLGSTIGGGVGDIAGRAIAAQFGVEATPAAVGKAIAEDPQASDKLAQLEAERGDEIVAQAQIEVERLKQETSRAQIAADDTEHARQAQLSFTDKDSVLGYMPTILSVLIVIGFFGACYFFLARPPTMTEATLSIVSLLLGKLSSSFDQVVQYHLGSSAGSRSKDETFKQIATTAATAVPAPTANAISGIVNRAVQT